MIRIREALSLWFIDMGLKLMPYKEVEDILRKSIYMTTSMYLNELDGEDYD